jgi:predicted ATPase
LTDELDELWQRRIVRAAGTSSDSFDFSHDKIRDVAYAELSPMKQSYWHLRIAEALIGKQVTVKRW